MQRTSSVLQRPPSAPPPAAAPPAYEKPNPYGSLCMPCAQRAKDFYAWVHSEHRSEQMLHQYLYIDEPHRHEQPEQRPGSAADIERYLAKPVYPKLPPSWENAFNPQKPGTSQPMQRQ